MNTTIIGAGNQGIYLAVLLSNNGYNVTIYTKKKYRTNKFELEDVEGSKILSSTEITITNNLRESLKDTKYIFMTYPVFMRKNILSDIKNICNDTTIVFVPNGVGSELLYKNIENKNIKFIGLERVPAICRLRNDNYVVAMSVKKELKISSLPINYKITKEIEKMFSANVTYNPIYPAISFTSSNPILHPSRIYNLFKNSNKETRFKNNIKFYETWDDESSKTLINCDEEMRKILDFITKGKYKGIKVTEHYDTTDYKSLTKKISTIESFKNIYAPLKENSKYYVIDLESRYFKEDFEYGLCTYKGYALLCNIETPTIDKIIYWYQNLISKEYIKDSNLGKDYKETGMPQAYGITNINQLDYLIK